jgi:hypothetical protein
MKKLLTILTLVCFGLPQVYTQNYDVNIPDNNLLQALIERGVDINGDEKISHAEAEAVTTLNLEAEGISDLTGIEAFLNLETFDCSGNQLSTLDVSYNTALSLLKCSDNSLIFLEGLNNTSLTELWCDFNELTYLEVSGNASLSHLNCSGNKLTTLYVSDNTALTGLWCNSNELTSLDVSKNTVLNALICSGNSLNILDLLNNAALTKLRCHGNQLANLDVSNNTALTELWCNSNELTSLDVSKNTNLEVFNCANNILTSLDLSNETALWYLNCGGNNMINLDISANPKLNELYLGDMRNLMNVCVWTLPFPTEGVNVYSKGSPYVNFTDDCTPPEILNVGEQPGHLEVTSSEDGNIWLLPGKKDRILDQIRDACIDSVEILANDPVNLSLASCKKVGVYWLYASDMNGNVSEPVSYTHRSFTLGNKVKSDEIFRMYPNPANSILTIETQQSGSCTIEITSITGQLIYKKEVEGASIQLDISSLHQGVYFITIRSRNSVRTGKLQKL